MIMHRITRRSIRLQKNVVSINISSDSDSDSDDSSEHRQSALDVINSFLNPIRTVVHVNYAPTPRNVSNAVSSFIQKNIKLEQASPSQFNSAVDVISTYLRKDHFGKNGTPVNVSLKEECSDISTSELGSEFLANKRQRRETESFTLDSDSDPNPNVTKKRRIENTTTAATVNSELMCKIESDLVACATVSIPEESSDPSDSPTLGTGPTTINEDASDIHTSTAEGPDHSNDNHTVVPSQQRVEQQSTSISTKRKTLRASKQNRSVRGANKTKSNVKSKQKSSPEVLKMSFTREVVSRKMRTRRVVEKQTTITDYQIPKEKYVRALDMLNATECRYDETPVDYNAPTPWYDFRKFCNGRRYREATYDTEKLGASSLVSLTRIVFELDNCLKKENWSRMAELIYFGCGLIKTDHNRRAIGGAFFTYALLLLILDSSQDSISTLEGKRSEINKFLTALGNDPEEIEEFLKELHLEINEDEANNGLLTIKYEVE